MTKDTVGKLSSELLSKQVDDTHSAHEQMQECLSDYDKNVYACVELGKQRFSSDFYVVVTTKRERLLTNVLRNYFLVRLSCPTPEYDQTVYKFNFKDESITFLWVVPSKDACAYMTLYASEIPTEEHELLNFVLKFNNGDLLTFAKKLNGEAAHSPLLMGE